MVINLKNISVITISILCLLLNLPNVIFNLDIIYAQVPGESLTDSDLGSNTKDKGSKVSDSVYDDEVSRDVNTGESDQRTDKKVERTDDPDRSDKEKAQIDKKDSKTEKIISEEEKSDIAKKQEKKKSSRKRRLNDGLLEITEGDFKYKRIPGLVDHEAASKNNIEEVEEENIEENASSSSPSSSSDSSDEAEKGMFGLSKDSTDIALKIVLFVMIAVIFFIFRFKSKGRSRTNVLKRFPK